jgi:maltoporin
MKRNVKFAMHTLGLAAALTATSASAVDFDGYFRAGPGATSKNAARACYNLGITGGH